MKRRSKGLLRSKRKNSVTEKIYGDVSSRNHCASPRRVLEPRDLLFQNLDFCIRLDHSNSLTLYRLIGHVSIITASNTILFCTTTPSCPLQPVQRLLLTMIRISIPRTLRSTLTTRDPIRDHLVFIRKMAWISTQDKAPASLIREPQL